MYERARALEIIERALDAEPYCPACSAPSTIVDDDGVLILRCSATLDPVGVIARIGAAMFPHLRRRVLDLREDLAA